MMVVSSVIRPLRVGAVVPCDDGVRPRVLDTHVRVINDDCPRRPSRRSPDRLLSLEQVAGMVHEVVLAGTPVVNAFGDRRLPRYLIYTGLLDTKPCALGRTATVALTTVTISPGNCENFRATPDRS